MEKEELKPMQPFFVFHTPMFYQRVYRKNGISHFFMFQGFDCTDAIYAVPDGCVDILFEYGEQGMYAAICGTVLSSKNAMISTSRYFGVRFQPGILPAIFPFQMKDVVDTQINLREVPIAKELIRHMEQVSTFTDSVQVFLEEYEKMCKTLPTIRNEHPIVTEMKEAIYQSDGNVLIGDLETQIGYSVRYLNRIFTEDMGFSPKTFCKIIQFQRTLECLNQKEKRLTDVAFEYGYYDQSQLIHDFKRFANVTPGEYKKLAKQKQYMKHLIEI